MPVWVDTYKGLPDKLGLAHFAEGNTLGKLGVFFPGQACLDYPAAVGRVVSFHGFQLSFYGKNRGKSFFRGFCQSCGDISPSNTYKPAKRKMDVDLQKIPLIPYNTMQAGIGGNL